MTSKTWKPESHWDEHPIYTVSEWQMDVENDHTRQGYHEYVQHCLDLATDEDAHENQLIDRAAPRWAWDVIDDLLYRTDVGDTDDDGDIIVFAKQVPLFCEANRAMILACERANDQSISRTQIQKLMRAENK